MTSTNLASAPVANNGTVQTVTSASMPEFLTDSFKSADLERQDEFSYRPIPVLAPITLVLGLCSIIGLATEAGLIVPISGVILGLLGWQQISKASGEYGGIRLTLIGLFLSSVFLLAGTSVHAYTYATEVPDGYERLSFRWLAQQKPIFEDGKTRVHPDVKALDGQKVFIKGYMYPENAKKNLKRFVLCKDTGQCCFGGKPAVTDIIVVDFVNKTRAQFRELSLVSVAGTFRAKKASSGAVEDALYLLEAEYFK